MPDAVIIGAGYGGMGIAALLAHAGMSVVVVEQSPLVGGRASSLTDDEGYRWEYGAHSHRLAEKGIASELFRRLGDEINFLPRADDARLIFRNRLWERPEGPLGYLKTPMLSLKGRLTLLGLLIKLKRSRPEDWYDRTLLDFYRTWFTNREVEDVLPLLGISVMCPDPMKVSAGEVIAFMRRLLAAGVSVGEPVGGSAQLFEKLRFHIESRGSINLDERALELIVEKGRVSGIRTEKDEYRTERVIYASRLPLLFEIADVSLLSDDFVDYCRNIENSSCLSFDFITNYPVTDIKGSILGVDIPVWARFQTNSDPSFTPQGKYLSTWGIMLPWGFKGEPEVVKATEKKLKMVISRIFPHLLPDLVRERKMIIPVMNGNVLTPGQSYPHRPEVSCDTIQGLYFVGDTVRGEGCSGDISFSSAMKAADVILGGKGTRA
ncbi:MAG TPA: FAD-dependent oxidoreductase [Deltaproteobacteria bacterium]|nr:FAD-dependent oxidoreductase [Deltaproteobacteria bacterium]HPR54394.1 FAD-dependent oxidoreductase [Deltaproteobacteria bacterium]HXK46277.1 FAD-dependent oxidoreductase [Deltaproteobacteria bacterium]